MIANQLSSTYLSQKYFHNQAAFSCYKVSQDNFQGRQTIHQELPKNIYINFVWTLKKKCVSHIPNNSTHTGAGGGTPRKIWWGCAAHFPKPLPNLWPKSVFFPTLFMTWPKMRYPAYDSCAQHSCPKHNVWRAFASGLIDNNEKVASSKQHTQFKTRVQKPYPI